MRPRFRDVVDGLPRPEPGRPRDPGLFGPGSVMWRLNGEVLLLAGGGRALLLQIANPLVAAGVADHSGFDRDPWERLWATLAAVLDVVFGDSEQAANAAGRVTQMHAGVTGSMNGARYRALDPDLLLWVHATLVSSALVTYERFVGHIGPAAKARFYQEMKSFATLFMVPPDALPADLPAFEEYWAASVGSLEVSDDARRLASGILFPPAPLALQPLLSVFRLATAGLLPSQARRGFGLAWSPRRAAAFRSLTATSRVARSLVPDRRARWPHAHLALARACPAGVSCR